MKIGFDKYTLQARVGPVLMFALPFALSLVLLVLSFIPIQNISNTLKTILPLSTILVPILLSIFPPITTWVRERGNIIQKKIYPDGLPTPTWLRHRDSNLGEKRKQRCHLVLSSKLPHCIWPSPQFEEANPTESDEIYEEAHIWLKENTRNHQILLHENIMYGFYRNALGIKTVAISLLLSVLIISALPLGYNYYGYQITINETKLTSEAIFVYLSIAVNIFALGLWSILITENNVKKQSVKYMTQIFTCCYQIEPTIKPPSSIIQTRNL